MVKELGQESQKSETAFMRYKDARLPRLPEVHKRKKEDATHATAVPTALEERIAGPLRAIQSLVYLCAA